MLHIVNYVIRIIIIIIGIVFLSGFVTPKNGDATFYNVMGVVFILFGIYRIALYRMKTKQYNFMVNEDEDEKINKSNKSS